MAERARMSNMPDAVVEALFPTFGQELFEYDALPDRKWAHGTLISVMNKHTVDLYLPGTSMIQMSNFGLRQADFDDSLQLYDKEGFTEIKVSIELFRHLIPNYSNLTFDQRREFAKNMLTGVSYRIPTQGLNSTVAVKIVDFLPSTNTSTVVLPAEFTTLTGADFDIDKLYFITYNYDVDKAGNVTKVKYLHEGNSTVKDRALAYAAEVFKDKIEDEKRAMREAYKELYSERKEYLQLLRSLRNEKDALEDLLVQTPETPELRKRINDIKSDLMFQLEEQMEAWAKANLAEFATKPIVQQNTTKAIENKLVDAYMAVLISAEHIVESKTPLDNFTGTLKNLATNITNLEGRERKYTSLQTASPIFQSEVRRKYSGGTFGIGPFALNNVHHIFGQIAKLYVKNIGMGLTREEEGKIVTDLGALKGTDGEFILDWLSALINAHVDIAKDPYIFALNVNSATYNAASFLIRAGYGQDTFKFLAQPILKEYARLTILADGRISGFRGRPANIVKNKYKNLLAKAASAEGIKAKEVPAGDFLNPDSLMKDINARTKHDAAYYARQLAILEKYQDISVPAFALGELVSASQIDTKKAGNNLVMFKRFNNLVNKVMHDKVIGNVDKLYSDTWLGQLYENSILLAFQLFSDSTLTATPTFLNTVDDIMASAGMRFSVSRKATGLLNNVSDELYASITSRFFRDVMKVTPEKLQELLLGDNNLAKRVVQLKEHNEYKTNAFVKLLSPILGLKPNDVNYVHTFNPVDIKTKYQKDRMINGWYELLMSSDPVVAKTAEDLVIYSFYTSGFKTNIQSFFSYLHPQYLKDIGFVEYVREARMALADSKSMNSMTELKDEVYRSLWYRDELVPHVQYTDMEHKHFYADERVKGTKPKARPYPNVVQVSSELTVDKQSLYIGRNELNEPLFRPYIKMRDKGVDYLYKYVGYRTSMKTGDVIGVYSVVPILGRFEKGGRMVKENGMSKSIFEDNNVIPTPESEFLKWQDKGDYKAIGGTTGKVKADYTGFSYLPSEYQWVDKVMEDITDINTNTPNFDKLPSKSATPTMHYTAIGSRGERVAIPEEVSRRFASAIKWLESKGFTVRTGDAIGMDALARENATKKQVYTAKDATPETVIIAKEIHPAPEAVDRGKNPAWAWNLHARNTNQLFGKDLTVPSDFVIAWTPDGATSTDTRSVETGGTGQAIDMASRKGIPVFNFANPAAPRQLYEYVNSLLGLETVETTTEESPFDDTGADVVFSTNPPRVSALVTEMGITSFDNVTAEQMKQLRDEYAHCKIG